MANCVQTIQEKINDDQISPITQLLPNTLTTITVTSSHKQLLIMDIVRQETTRFTISLVSSIPPTNVGVTVTFYEMKQGNILVNLGSALITEMIMTFQKDLTPGIYIICIGSTSFSYSGTILGIFTGTAVYAKLSLTAYTGQNIFPDIIVPLPDRVCRKTLYFSILDGSLPFGLNMNPLGNIEGLLPNMDCIEDNKDLSPSQNWYYNLDESWQPWGRQWRFLVKVWVFDYPQAFTTRWFCIRVHNNWSWDRDNFQPPFEIEGKSKYEPPFDVEIKSIPEPKPPDPTIGDLCCEPVPEPVPTTILKVPVLCPKEDVSEPVPATILKVPVLCPCETETPVEQVTVLNFLQWYKTVLSQPQDDNPDMQQFISNFQGTEFYADMMKTSGMNDALLTKEEKEKTAVNTLINQYINALENGRRVEDIDYIMFQLRDKENQKLPLTIISQSGTTMTIEFGERL